MNGGSSQAAEEGTQGVRDRCSGGSRSPSSSGPGEVSLPRPLPASTPSVPVQPVVGGAATAVAIAISVPSAKLVNRSSSEPTGVPIGSTEMRAEVGVRVQRSVQTVDSQRPKGPVSLLPPIAAATTPRRRR